MISTIFKNMVEFQRQLDADDKRKTKASQTSVKVESYRLVNELRKEIKEGAPGGRKFDPLSEIAKRAGKRGMKRKPLAKLAFGVNYYAKQEGKHYKSQVGFLSEGRKKASKSFIHLVKKHAEGSSQNVTEGMRSYFRRIGAGLKKRKPNIAKYFFLLPGTQQLKTPARPIIDPFWDAHRHEVMGNIKSNFKRKMKGERI